jgi:hypothetical protein
MGATVVPVERSRVERAEHEDRAGVPEWRSLR